MKKILVPLILYVLFLIPSSWAQHVGIGTLTPTGALHVKSSQDISALIIDANSVQSNTSPLFKLRNSQGIDLLWIHADDTSNVFIGLQAGKVNSISGGGALNTFIGSNAGRSNTAGAFNTVIGGGAFFSNTTGSNNSAFGSVSLFSNTSGANNSATGTYSLSSNTLGMNNTANGFGSLFSNTTGDNNTSSGIEALYSNTTGFSNTAIGTKALYTNTTRNNMVAIGDSALFTNGQGASQSFQAINNTGVGSKSLFANSTGSGNTAIGYNSMKENTTGANNTAQGSNTLFSNTVGGFNVAQGTSALYFNSAGSANAAFGNAALLFNTVGSNNTSIGTDALINNTSGSNNTAIGFNANVSAGDLTNATAIGSKAMAGASNSVVIGSINGINGATTTANVGIGTSTPHSKAALEVKSTDKGILFPGLTNAQRDAITDPPHGLHIFNTEERCLNYYDSVYQVWNCYCDDCKTIIIDIDEDACKVDFYTSYAISRPANKYVINIPNGVTISGCTAGDSALTFVNMPISANITIHNHGTIAGGGGNGGSGTIEEGCGGLPAIFATSGAAGGYAIATKPGVSISINNYGIVEVVEVVVAEVEPIRMV